MPTRLPPLRLRGSTRLCWPGLALLAAMLLGAVPAASANPAELLRLSEQLDRLDQQDFDEAITQAERCISARDFVCAETQLRAARKTATQTRARQSLKQSEDKLLAERERARQEALELARRQHEIELAQARQREREEFLEARRLEDARQARQDEAEQNAARMAQFGQLLNQSIQNQAAMRQAEQQRARQFQQMQADVAAGLAQQQRRFAEERARLAAQHASAAAPAPAAAPARAAAAHAAQAAAPELVAAVTASSRGAPTGLATGAPAARPATSPATAATQATAATPAVSGGTAPTPAAASASDAGARHVGPGNTGRVATACVQVSRDREDVSFTNHCPGPVFVFWCGDMKHSKKRCGDGPAGNSYYTHSNNIRPGDTVYARDIGEYRFGACEGAISFGKDEFQDQPDGSYVCTAARRKS